MDFRHSGSLYISHLLNTAGIVEQLGGGEDCIKAALLHSVYRLPEPFRLTRHEVKQIIGIRAERIVFAYSVRAERNYAEQLEVLLIRAANVIEQVPRTPPHKLRHVMRSLEEISRRIEDTMASTSCNIKLGSSDPI